MNLGPSRYKAFNFTLEKNKIFLITQFLDLTLDGFYGVGFRNFLCMQVRVQNEGKTRENRQTLVMCFNV